MSLAHALTETADPFSTFDPAAVRAGLDERGYAHLPNLLSRQECEELAALYDDERRFRSTVIMERHRFGRGAYRYFADPLPPQVAALRSAAYDLLAPTANAWNESLARDGRFPASLPAFRQQCAAAGQTRPTPLLLRYGEGDFNCLHQDVYGALSFPIQVAILLDRPGIDFEGGEFVLTEQRPRAQSRAMVVPLKQGDAVAFAVRERPVTGTRGSYRVTMRHGVSTVRSGRRHVLGLIMHDAP